MTVVTPPLCEQQDVVQTEEVMLEGEFDGASKPDNEFDGQPAPSANAVRPAKRARKAVNCDPCRTSKLKCDKARPCSSCVLRGTISQCCSDRRDDTYRHNGVDPHNELARIRQSLATLEAYMIRSSRNPEASSSARTRALLRDSLGGYSAFKQESDAETLAVPGILQNGNGGFYSGPTSTTTLLYSLKTTSEPYDISGLGDASCEDVTRPRRLEYVSDADDAPTDVTRGYDDDLLAQLPSIHVIDGLVDYYLHFCSWMYRHVHASSFTAAWNRFKACASADRLVLSTLSAVMAVAVRYLPERHGLLKSLPAESREELGDGFYSVSCESLMRYRAECRSLSLELVELLLIQSHYLALSQVESEDIWKIRGELVSIGAAMGLHRDPNIWRMPREIAERRRWAWWHIVLLDRWQCLHFGRPLSVASHHFDTRLPCYLDSKVDSAGRSFYPNIYMFKLADILGEIVDDTVSCRPATYSRVLELDKMLEAWLDELPSELDLDEYCLARSLASPHLSEFRLGVLSSVIRSAFYYLRFTLHRSYASSNHVLTHPISTKKNNLSKNAATNRKINQEQCARTAQSLDMATGAADKLIQLIWQAQHGTVSVAGAQTKSLLGCHLHQGAYHCFSAATFFSLQLVAAPRQLDASLLRENVRRTLDVLELSRSPGMGTGFADKASEVLIALRPLYDPDVMDDEDGGRTLSEARRTQALALVQSLAFPYKEALVSSSVSSSSLLSPAERKRSCTLPSGDSPRSGHSHHSSGSSTPLQGALAPHAQRSCASSNSSSSLPISTNSGARSFGGTMPLTVSPLVAPHRDGHPAAHSTAGLTLTPTPSPASASAPTALSYSRVVGATPAAAATNSSNSGRATCTPAAVRPGPLTDCISNGSPAPDSDASIPLSKKTAAAFPHAVAAAAPVTFVGPPVSACPGGVSGGAVDEDSMWSSLVGFG